ncbi:hypothetical protein NL676_033205 [Syzygium grande]|nr:hypothetical protein NL676_033205 [Syzygium grande]
MASTPLEYAPRFSSINTGHILRSFSSLSSSFTFSSLLAASKAFAIRSTHSDTIDRSGHCASRLFRGPSQVGGWIS